MKLPSGFKNICLVIEMIKRVYNYCKGFTDRLNASNAAAFASSAAFFVFLSFIPTIMLVYSILPFTNINSDILLNIMDDFFPHNVSGFINEIVMEVDKSVALISLSAIITLWVSGKGFWALMGGLNSIHGLKEKRNVITLRIWGSIYTVGFLLVTIFSLVIIVYGKVIFNSITNNFQVFSYIYEFIIHFRFLFIWIIFLKLFQLIYKFVPSAKLKFSHQFPGALFAAAGWTICSYIFSLYIDLFGEFSIYGSLTTIIITMFWLYYCMYIILIGALINIYFEPFYRRRERNNDDNLQLNDKNQNE